MCDYYVTRPERKCGPWVDLTSFTIPVRITVPRKVRLTSEERAEIALGRQRQRHSERTRKKIAKALRGKSKSTKHKEAIATKMRGRHVSETTRMKMSLSATTRNFRVVQIPG